MRTVDDAVLIAQALRATMNATDLITGAVGIATAVRVANELSVAARSIELIAWFDPRHGFARVGRACRARSAVPVNRTAAAGTFLTLVRTADLAIRTVGIFATVASRDEWRAAGALQMAANAAINECASWPPLVVAGLETANVDGAGITIVAMVIFRALKARVERGAE